MKLKTFTHSFLLLTISLLLLNCTKEKTPVPIPKPEKDWEKFLGDYKVYDTLGKYLYNSKITHFSSINAYNITVDSLIIHNFADTMDLAFEFNYSADKNEFNFGFHYLIKDYYDKSWQVTSNFDDPSTSLLENNIQNGTMTLYFKMTNIKYYLNENVAYYNCDCKHVFVKN